ncbi:MAG TPA: hypothetical protein VGL59_07285 [Polyangia bacterium]
MTMGCSRVNTAFSTCMACHTTVSAEPSGGGFDMQKTGWEKNLIGKSTPADAPDTALCKGKNLVLLEANVEPAKGLFLDKLNLAMPPCGDRMPKLLNPLSTSDLACVQAWANSIVAGGTGQ